MVLLPLTGNETGREVVVTSLNTGNAPLWLVIGAVVGFLIVIIALVKISRRKEEDIKCNKQ